MTYLSYKNEENASIQQKLTFEKYILQHVHGIINTFMKYLSCYISSIYDDYHAIM